MRLAISSLPKSTIFYYHFRSKWVEWQSNPTMQHIQNGQWWKALGLLVLLAGLPSLTRAQGDNLRYNAGLYGVMLTKPGVRLGAEYTFLERTQPLLLGQYLGLTQSVKQRWVVTPQLGVYWDPLSYTAWQLTVEAGHIAPLVGSFVRQVRLGGGIHQSIFPEVYEVNGSTVTPLGMATRSFGAASTTLGVGYERGPNILWLNLHGLVLVNYNTTVLPMAAAEVSYQFTLNSSRR